MANQNDRQQGNRQGMNPGVDTDRSGSSTGGQPNRQSDQQLGGGRSGSSQSGNPQRSSGGGQSGGSQRESGQGGSSQGGSSQRNR